MAVAASRVGLPAGSIVASLSRNRTRAAGSASRTRSRPQPTATRPGRACTAPASRPKRPSPDCARAGRIRSPQADSSAGARVRAASTAEPAAHIPPIDTDTKGPSRNSSRAVSVAATIAADHSTVRPARSRASCTAISCGRPSLRSSR